MRPGFVDRDSTDGVTASARTAGDTFCRVRYSRPRCGKHVALNGAAIERSCAGSSAATGHAFSFPASGGLEGPRPSYHPCKRSEIAWLRERRELTAGGRALPAVFHGSILIPDRIIRGPRRIRFHGPNALRHPHAAPTFTFSQGGRDGDFFRAGLGLVGGPVLRHASLARRGACPHTWIAGGAIEVPVRRADRARPRSPKTAWLYR